MRFLTTNVDETWYQELETAKTFYTKVTAFEMMAHLRKCSGGWNVIDTVNIMSVMQQYFNEVEIIPIYIKMMEMAKNIIEPSSQSQTTCCSP